jgi:DNA-binding protein H-NS
MPFFLPKDAPDPRKAQNIVDEAAQKIKAFEQELKKEKWLEGQREDEAKKVRRGLEQSIQDYYDIDEYEAMLIKDTLDLSIKSSTPGETTKDIPTLKNVSSEKCEIYTKTLCEMLNHFGEGSPFKVAGEVFRGTPYSVVQVSLAQKTGTTVKVSNASDKLKDIFKRMESLLKRKEGVFVFCQNLKVFDGDNLYILKPMQMRFWSRTAALNDADEIAGAIINAKGRRK